jgi:hypothetical protein
MEGTGKILTISTNAIFHENSWSCSRPYVAELAEVYSCLNLLLGNSPYTPLVCESQKTKPKPNLHLRMEGSEVVLQHVYLIFGNSTIHIDIC